LQPVSKAEALEQVRGWLSPGSKVIGIGSPRASLEANFALRAAVGAENFFAGLTENELRLLNLVLAILKSGPAPAASLREVETSDAVLILGEDVTNYIPRMALSLRQSVRQQPMSMTDKLKIPRWLDHSVREAVQDGKGPLFIASLASTRLDDVAAVTYRAAPDDLARLGFAVAHALDENAPAPPQLPPEVASLAARISEALQSAQRPLVISGVGCRNESVVKAAANVARALKQRGKAARIAFAVPECNSLGLALLDGPPLEEAFAAARTQSLDTVIVLENDLYRRAPAAQVDTFFEAALHVMVLDHLENATTKKAELALPAGTFAEADGTFVNNEARAQRCFQVFVPPGEIQESWRWLRDLMVAAERREFAQWEKLDDVIAALVSSTPALARVTEAAPLSGFRIAGEKVPRQPHRYSGRTAMLTNIDVSEPRPPDDPDSALSYSMEGSPDQPPSGLIPFAWSPGWNSYQAWNKFQEEIAGPLRGGNPGVRLLESTAQSDADYFRDVPPEFQRRDREWLIVPLYHIFGSEELSTHSQAVNQLAPLPYVAMNGQDAMKLNLRPEERVMVTIDGRSYDLPLKIRADLRAGVAALPAGIPPIQGINFPSWASIAGAS
jgi:NADH-quinone oxidoreductase subunit G